MSRSVRVATVKDLNAMASLATSTFLETFGHLYAPDDLNAFLKEAYDTEVVRHELEDPKLTNLLVEADGIAVGYTRYGPCKLPIEKTPAPALELHRLYVAKSYHGQGFGTALMEAVLDAAAEKAAKSVFLGVWEGNLNAQKFYANYGFKEVGEYRFYVGSHADRELILRKLL